MYEAAFKNIDDTLWKDAGCSSELDYIEQAFNFETLAQVTHSWVI